MYEAFYGLTRRPFAATPDAGCWFKCGQYQAALDELLVCAEQGQGIGILVAPAGTGKTLLCERLIREIGEPFTSVLLRHATYNTRRGFLQTLLCELAQPYDKHTDQELRLGLAPVLKGLHQQGRSLLVVVDEAHQLSESLLEELRILADQAEDGQPIVRLVLAGQFGLEEKLALPGLQALNQRIRAHVALESLSLADSADYIDYRITWGGGRTSDIFTDDAVATICRAADGVPRCINQLCDHALLLGFANEQRPVTAETIATALGDLRHLPLPWNLSGLPSSETSSFAMTSDNLSAQPSSVVEWDTVESEPVSVGPTPLLSSLEFGGDVDDDVEDLVSESDGDNETAVVEDLHDRASVSPVPEPPQTNDVTAPPREMSADLFYEEPVFDRYNALDAGLELPVMPQTVTPQFAGLPFSVTTTLFGSDIPLTDRLDAIQDVLDAVTAPEDPQENLEAVAQIGVEPETELLSDEAVVAPPVNPDPETEVPVAAVFEFGAEEPDVGVNSETSAAVVTPMPEPRSCRNLFTRLRRKQLGR